MGDVKRFPSLNYVEIATDLFTANLCMSNKNAKKKKKKIRHDNEINDTSVGKETFLCEYIVVHCY